MPTSRQLTLATLAACTLVLAACGKKDEAPAPAPTPAPAATPAPAPTPTPSPTADAGKAIYNKTCALCHSAGVGGAPKSGDKADWAPRIAQGKDVLYKHAIEGYTGAKGMMPARGGNTSLSDDEVKMAVDYQVSINQ
ncbi:MAG: c-type cytochrome [Proteobacteria bacterium]|nr:c-type cytochrome [Pseudomonadota bacterium]